MYNILHLLIPYSEFVPSLISLPSVNPKFASYNYKPVSVLYIDSLVLFF